MIQDFPAHLSRFLPVLVLPLLAGCVEPREGAAEHGPLPEAAQEFDPSSVGSITGTVTWEGKLPRVPPMEAPTSAKADSHPTPKRSWPHPNTPVISSSNRGVAGAVVYLADMSPVRGRPWDHPLVRVELRGYQIHVHQGTRDGPVGFARCGDIIHLASHQEGPLTLRGRGASTFSLPFPEVDKVQTRHLDHPGVLRLSSGSGQPWMHAYVLVDHHPYYTLTDADGRYTLSQVPPGDYRVVCWMPSWRTLSFERDADTCQVSRLELRPPVELARGVRVLVGKTCTVDWAMSAKQFE
jgi:hypothetical protein